jgi:molybdopterin-guanine dinucleotide biosynthesis protein A
VAEPEHDAVVLAGGTARRLGGADKPGLLVGERTLLDRVLDAVPGAERVIVVGPPRATSRTVEWCREEPPGGGPVAAIAAGLDLVRAPLVLVLAGDLPFLSPAVATSLLDAVGESDGAMLVDGNGRDQLLVGAWRTSALRSALPAEPAGARLASVVGGLHVTRVSASAAPGRPDPWFDCDTELDLATARGTT